MLAAPSSRLPIRRLLAGLVVLALAGSALVAAAGARASAPAPVPCPLSAADVSAAVGRTLQRVSLDDPKADPSGRCAFAVVVKGKTTTPEVYLTTFAGDSGDLREMSAYYAQVRSKLATKPKVVSRPDLGPGAFTLTATGLPVTTLYFVLGKGTIGALAVDLTDAPAAKRADSAFEKIFGLALAKSR